MNTAFKLVLVIALGLVFLQACEQKAKSLETIEEVANAIRKNDTNTISAWLKNGANPNKSMEGQSLLYIATGPKGGAEMVKLLIESGANINQGAGKYTPLMNAASWVSINSVQLLLKNGADKTTVNERGQTAFDLIGDCGNCPEQIQLKALLK